MGNWIFVLPAVYASIGLFLFIKATSAIFCIMSGGTWSSLADEAPQEMKDGLVDLISDFNESSEEIDNEVGGIGFVKVAATLLLSIAVVIVFVVKAVEFVVAWPYLRRKRIARSIGSMIGR
ncbi:MAG: hypothetical protein ACRCXB_27855 [Aeromonadaceae bacterium]